MQSLSKFMLEKVMGWKVVNRFPTELKKYIIIVAPHTSWVDFPVGVFVNYSQQLGANYIAKHTLFKPPFGFIFSALGGTPVDRSKSESRVEAIIKIFKESDRFVLTLSPEGTRKSVSKWKTGFYYVAKGAQIPVVMCGFDYGKKEIVVAEPYTLTGDEKIDFQHFHEFFKHIEGKKRDQFDPDFHLNV
ncbi:1-acyl-sn-glycerol-3-phosphate acyltransferase [Namhaeicola litoreus]|uniref:1-acyl-sn-glycerol-3-phosphate acyltransferase n=1 Tax=Namhaeicola litoreus TaxID=1052145 RepID=A0ABW3Y3X0_9FLAO